MAPIAIGFGVLLTLLGAGVYAYTDFLQFTAFIPAFFGLPLIGLGVLARNENFRMHAMHGAALIGLVGFAMPAIMVIVGLSRGDAFGLGNQERTAMSVICGVFLALCVKSFIDARKARKEKEAQTQGQAGA